MSADQSVFVTSVQDAAVDELCQRRYWLQNLEGGIGLVRKDDLVPNALLEESIRDIRTIGTMEDLTPGTIQDAIDEITSALSPEDKADVRKMECLYRRLGWLAAWALYVEPEVRVKYTNIPIDFNATYQRNPLWVMTTPGRVLQEKDAPQDTIYQEFMPFPQMLGRQHWLQSWLYNIRLHIGIAAATDELNRMIDFGEVVGLAQGYRSSVDGRLSHPYVWAYRHKTTGRWASTISSLGAGSSTPEWEAAPVWEFAGGVVRWVQQCGETVARGQFPVSPRTTLNSNLLTGWGNKRLRREREIRAMGMPCRDNGQLRDIHFAQSTVACRPAMGDPCPFLKVCWDRSVAQAPLRTGDYVENSVNTPIIFEGSVH